MYRTIFSVVVFGSASCAVAGPFVCAQDTTTFAVMCFASDGVRKNGDVRAAKFYQGGPKNVENTGWTARVHCGTKVLELTDRKGVAFARNVPQKQVGKDFVTFLCSHDKTKNDAKLSTH